MFRIHFQGLITHAHLDDGWVAAIFYQQQHSSILTVRDTDWIKDDTTTPPESDNPDEHLTCFRMAGRLRLRNVEGGPLTVKLDGVPHLADISDGKRVHNDVTYKNPGSLFRGFLDFEGGLLTIDDWFLDNVTFDGTSLRCLPRTVLYSDSATDDTVYLDITDARGDTTHIALYPHADVWLTNLDVSSDAPVEGEYSTYNNFFYDATTIKIPKTAKGIRCAYGTDAPPRATCRKPGTLGVECSNNQFP